MDGYYFIQNPATGLVIGISSAKKLDVYTENDHYPRSANQLWCFVPATTPGYYTIESHLDGSVVDVEGSNTSPGTLLDAHAKNTSSPGNDNQLWMFVDTNGPSIIPPASPTVVPEPSSGYYGSINYILANGSSCATLTGVRATIYVTEDLVWESTTKGTKTAAPSFGIQLNAETNADKPLNWLQFTTHMGDDEGLWPWMNIWSPAGIVWNQRVEHSVAKMPKAAFIPNGYILEVSLHNDATDSVTAAKWSVFDREGKSVGSISYSLSTSSGGGVAPGDLCPIASFQVTFGGPDDGSHATFSSGAGLIVFHADQAMAVSTGYPNCIGYKGGTAETSNVAYGPMSAVPAKLLAQTFKVMPDSTQVRIANPQARKAPHPA